MKRGERGSALIEFSVSAAFLVLVMIGVSDLVRVFHYSDIATTAARAGVQYAMVSRERAADLDGIQAAALAEPGALEGLKATATSFSRPMEQRTARYVQVKTEYPFRTMITWPGFSNPVVITGQATMRVE